MSIKVDKKHNSYYTFIMNLLLDRVAFVIFNTEIYWYGIIMAIAIVTAFALSFLLLKPKNLPKDFPIDVFLFIVPIGIIGARLFSVLFDPGTTILDFFAFRNGGMSIIGAVLGGIVGVLILCAVKKYKFFIVADMIVPVLILAQAIGRWGNFANMEVFGLEVTNTAWQFFPFAVNANGTWHLALFFYEFCLNLIGFVILMILYFKTKKSGICTSVYLIYYGLIRLILESFRMPNYVLKLGTLPISQILSGVFLVAGIVILIIVLTKKERKEIK